MSDKLLKKIKKKTKRGRTLLRSKKAQISEGLNFALGTVVIFFILFFLILGSLFLVKEDPQVQTSLKNYATTEQNFRNENYVVYQSGEIAITLQAILATEKNFVGENRKVSMKEALLIWTQEPAQKIVNKEYFPQASAGYLVFSTLEEVIQKSISKAEYPVSRREEYNSALKKPCYYFSAAYTQNGKEKRSINMGSLVKPTTYYTAPRKEGNLYLLDHDLDKDFENLMQKQATHLILNAPEGFIDIYLYINNKGCN